MVLTLKHMEAYMYLSLSSIICFGRGDTCDVHDYDIHYFGNTVNIVFAVAEVVVFINQ